MTKAGVKVAPYTVINTLEDLNDLDLSKKHVVKTATGGYDGHGQVVVKNIVDWEEARELADLQPCVSEEFVSFLKKFLLLFLVMALSFLFFQFCENLTSEQYFR